MERLEVRGREVTPASAAIASGAGGWDLTDRVDTTGMLKRMIGITLAWA
jgi:hypothetical protein